MNYVVVTGFGPNTRYLREDGMRTDDPARAKQYDTQGLAMSHAIQLRRSGLVSARMASRPSAGAPHD